MDTLQKTEPISQIQLTDQDIQTLVEGNIIPQGTPKAQIAIFARSCMERNLSPFSKQIYLMKRETRQGTRYSHQTSIDGFRTISESTCKYAGSDDYLFDEGLTMYEMIRENRKPTTATATVHKILPSGQIFPIRATAAWASYYPGGSQSFMWDKMPYLMLGKCAEALALRKAFPEKLGSIYVNEEMQQIEPDNHITEEPIYKVEDVKKPENKEVNPSDKYDNLFKGKKPEEIRAIYAKLSKAEQGKEKIACKIATFWIEDYNKKNEVNPNGLVDINLLIKNIKAGFAEQEFQYIDSQIEIAPSQERANLIHSFQNKLDEIGSKYEIQSLPF